MLPCGRGALLIKSARTGFKKIPEDGRIRHGKFTKTKHSENPSKCEKPSGAIDLNINLIDCLVELLSY